MPSPPDFFSKKGWKTGKLTVMESFGFSKLTAQVPELRPQLPDKSAQAQHPIAVEGGSAAGVGGGGNLGNPPPQKGKYTQYARKLLGQHGWSNQFSDLNALIMSESGWNPHIKNPNSQAYGIAQALGHGNGNATQGTESNMYGGFGLTDKQAKEANSGNGYWQLVWMMNYIKQSYGTPANAWTFKQANGWY